MVLSHSTAKGRYMVFNKETKKRTIVPVTQMKDYFSMRERLAFIEPLSVGDKWEGDSYIVINVGERANIIDIDKQLRDTSGVA